MTNHFLTDRIHSSRSAYGVVILLVSTCLLIRCSSEPKATITEATSKTDTISTVIDLRPWFQAIQAGEYKDEIQTVRITKNFVSGVPKTYEAISLRSVLQSQIALSAVPPTAMVKMVCKDGYVPAHRLGDLPLESGWLAFRDIDAPEGYFWEISKEESYAPFYLVWDDPELDAKSVSWPYGLTHFEITLEDPHASITPMNDHRALQGFQLYEQRCIKCHSINKVGGNVGPELNFPKSITEYMEKEIIWQYTKDPRSFRYNSAMHGTEDITREEFDLLYHYLTYMRGRRPQSP